MCQVHSRSHQSGRYNESPAGKRRHNAVPAYFYTRSQDVNAAEDINLDAIVSKLLTQCDSWQSRGRNFVIEHIVKFVACITKYRPVHSSSFIETPKHIAKKKCTVNIYNTDHNASCGRCWHVCIHPPATTQIEYRIIYHTNTL